MAIGTGCLGLSDRDARALGDMGNLVRHAANEQPLQVAETACSHHNKVGILFFGASEDHLGGVALSNLPRNLWG